MTALTTKLFLDVKEFEKYQEMLKKQVHLDEKNLIDSTAFPDKHIYHRAIRVLNKNNGSLTNRDFLLQYNFRVTEVLDLTNALVKFKMVTKQDGENDTYTLTLTEEGKKAAQWLEDRRNKISEAAYNTLTPEEQQELDNLVNKLTENYKGRDVNYMALKNMMFN
ncbi:hypothetical protein [Lactobacillus sp. PV034]|uniref:hypothetical protein n=1 Tax=Lactobacillus sp. PV034 TaxID=2594495 RepID=UPI002240B4FC|nr:hypothetical protein [Lactobacillus sp. PV034]QNQ80227.1 hypothetical protein FP432_00990 [Lactobacillus sp. PV034]